MVVEELGIEENKPCATFAELNRHLESALPEVYLKDIYNYLRDCEVGLTYCLILELLRLICILYGRNVIDPSPTTCVNNLTLLTACAPF